jgi:hypothetical protein
MQPGSLKQLRRELKDLKNSIKALEQFAAATASPRRRTPKH